MRIFMFLAVVSLSFLPFAIHKKVITGVGQGTTYHITYFSTDTSVSKKQIDSILTVIDSSLSVYKPYSLISRFNRAEREVLMDDHFKNVVLASLKTYKETNGLFDITVAPLVTAWGFGWKKITSMPDSSQIEGLKACVSSEHIKVKNDRVIKDMPCVQLDVNGIAQGYTVDVIAAFLDVHHIDSYIVEVGGELRVKGRKPDGTKMRIGIEAPNDNPLADEMMEKVIELDSGAVTTSGNYRKFYESNGQRVNHLIDPRTGYSVNNEMISATVYAKDAITADAFDNALMLMGMKDAITFVNKRSDIAAYLIYKKKDNTVADTASAEFYKLMKQ